MSLRSTYYATFVRFLNSEKNERAITIFCKCLYVFLLIKIVFLVPVLSDIMQDMPLKSEPWIQSILFAPAKLAQFNSWLFLGLFICFIALGFFIKTNHYITILIFWFSFSLSRLIQPIMNGSDLVLNLFLFLSIFFNVVSISQKEIRLAISNFAVLFCRIQLALIYFLSGYDKLLSAAWRSGDAIYSIQHLDFFVNERFSSTFSQQASLYFAWLIISFELLFPILIWIRKIRLPFLIVGVVFHIGIIIFLNLPDFGIIMILSYLIFYPFKDSKKDLTGSVNFQSALL